MAAAERGYRVRVEAFPDGEPGPRELPGGRVGARLLLEPDPSLAQDPLFVQIKQRHTNKGPFDLTRTVPAPVWQSFQACATDKGLMAGAVTDSAEMEKVREITRNSFETEILTQRTHLESARLMRIGPDEVSRHRDGIPLMGSMVRTLSAVGM